MSTIDSLRVLDSVDKPDGLDVEVVHDPAAFMDRKATLNKTSSHWFGSAFKQGQRLQFTTSMPLQDYLSVAKFDDRAKKGSTVEELRKASNRHKIESHQKDIRVYLGETACVGEKFILPNFMINYGAEWTDDAPRARLTLLVMDAETLAWPAIFEPPTGLKMTVTDGAHRSASIEETVRKFDNKEGVAALLANGVGVTIVMEASRDDAHQDFADVGRAKPIADSVISTWDKRNVLVSYARGLVAGSKFLSRFVDATSPSVNLSTNSTKVWSMSAVRGYLLGALPSDKKFADLTADEKTALLDAHRAPLTEFLAAIVAEIPILRGIAMDELQPGTLRKQRGGCILLRGAGFGFLMRCYRHGAANGLKPAAMAKKLAAVDWHVLKPNAGQPPVEGENIYAWLRDQAAQPAWFQMLAVDPKGTYRIKGTSLMIEAAFDELQESLGF